MAYLLTSLISRAFAQGNTNSGNFALDLHNLPVAAGNAGFKLVFNNIVSLIFGFLAVAAFVGIVYSGIMMITAGGDAAKFSQGRKNLLWAIIGIVIISLAFVIIRLTLGVANQIIK